VERECESREGRVTELENNKAYRGERLEGRESKKSRESREYGEYRVEKNRDNTENRGGWESGEIRESTENRE